jgi:hypothetical protein
MSRCDWRESDLNSESLLLCKIALEPVLLEVEMYMLRFVDMACMNHYLSVVGAKRVQLRLELLMTVGKST